ncbi:MAG: universal stress protein [Bryobacteraceae bacterium]
MHRILFPVDFSEPCAATAPFVASMANLFDASVTMLHVVDAPDLPRSNGAAAKAFRSLASHRCDEAGRRLETWGEPELSSAERLVCAGDVAAEIVKSAEATQSDLIMMPTRGSGGMRRFLIGSVTAKVLHDAGCPVWTGVHLDRPHDPALNTPVLCAVNLADENRESLRWADGFARAAHVRLVVVHAMPPMASGDGEGARERLVRWHAQALSALEDMLAEEEIQADVVLHAGEPPQVVAASAERTHAALVVIGRGSAGGMSGSLKANAYSIVRSSPCPVVSV